MVKKIICIICLLSAVRFSNGQLKEVSLFPADDALFNSNDKNSGAIQWINVSGAAFKKAYRVTSNAAGDNRELNLKYAINEPVKKGDVMLLSFYSRTISSMRETGLAFFEIGLDRFVNGKYAWPPVMERGMSFGRDWVLTQIPFMAAMDVAVGDLAFILKTGKVNQVFEIGGFSLVNYKQGKTVNELPRSTVHYDGDAANASWRKPAEERIEKFRKANIAIKVVDKNGKPVPGAAVSVQMKQSAFAWGTATASQMILDTTNPNAKIYRDTLLRYFNKVVLENEMKAKNWHRFNTQQTQAGVDWFKSHNISVRGHVMVWPSWQHSPHLVKYQNDTAALRFAVLKIIEGQTTLMKGNFSEWDVVNEPYAHHEIMDTLGGKPVMLQWFNAAHKNAPGVQLFLNDYTMFHEKDRGSEAFFNNVKYLLDNKAPIHAIGEQAHIGGTPPSINYVLERLDRFAAFGLPIQVSEFDITSDDDDFKARYMRDFLTALFSHPATNGFVQWGFWEGMHWMPAGAMWDKNWNLRPHGKVFTDLVTKTWSTNVNGITKKNGLYDVRGFNGEYEVTVTAKGKTISQRFVLDSKGKLITVKL